ncbi:MAG: SIMPL domain-containing protein [Chloroflexaceae bacterium]|nr:SIMPL domain-containing protein [Chloroflexaceae bacterium]
MSRRIAVISGALAGTLVFVALVVTIGMVATAPAPIQTASESAIVRQITVVGFSEIKGTPDTAHVQIGVETEGKTAQDALRENNEQASKIVDQLTELGIAEKDIQTSNFNISPTYDDRGRWVTGYQVSNIVAVTIRDMDQTSSLLDQVVQVGANRIYGIYFSVDDPSALLAEARDKAMHDAEERASRLARAGGAEIGTVLMITENIGSPTFPPVPVARMALPMMDQAKMETSASPPPVYGGEQSFSAQVQVTYELR